MRAGSQDVLTTVRKRIELVINEIADAKLIAMLRTAMSELDLALAQSDTEPKRDVREAFDSWRQENAAVLGEPIIVSLLYDLNRLPEVILAFNYDPDMVRQTVLIVEHFKRWKKQSVIVQPDAEP